MLSKLISHIQKDAGSDYDDEDIVVDDDDTAKNGLVNRNVNWRLSCWPLAMAASAFKKDTSLVLWNRAGGFTKFIAYNKATFLTKLRTCSPG